MVKLRLEWPDRKLSPNSRVYRAVKAQAIKEARTLALIQARNAGIIIPDGKLEMRLLFCPPDKRHRDQDNVLAMLKPSIDGIFLSCEADDKQIKRTVLEWGQVEKGGAVYVEIMELI